MNCDRVTLYYQPKDVPTAMAPHLRQLGAIGTGNARPGYMRWVQRSRGREDSRSERSEWPGASARNAPWGERDPPSQSCGTSPELRVGGADLRGHVRFPRPVSRAMRIKETRAHGGGDFEPSPRSRDREPVSGALPCRYNLRQKLRILSPATSVLSFSCTRVPFDASTRFRPSARFFSAYKPRALVNVLRPEIRSTDDLHHGVVDGQPCVGILNEPGKNGRPCRAGSHGSSARFAAA
jgi:hypothetical protein